MAMPDTTRPTDEDDNDPLLGTEADPIAADPDELQLGEDEVRLPWLEGEDDEDEYRGGGGGQIALLAVMAVAALALIIGGIWWFTRDKRDGTMVADGGVIEAPAQPYKEKPRDPGGKTFQGTGDSSFAVSEGETRTARLGEAGEAPKPGFEGVGSDAKPVAPAVPAAGKAPAAPKATPAPDAAQPAGPSVQVGAYTSREAAEAGWTRLSSQLSVLSGQRHRVAEGRAEFGTVYRLQVLPGDAAAARKLCSDLKRAGQDCTVKN